MAMLTVRARRFLQRTGRNLKANGPTSIGFDMSKVECYNCHKKGHFTRECRSPKDTRRNVIAEPQRRNVLVETSTSNALVSQCDGLESVEAELLVYQKNENVFEEDIKFLKLDVQLRDNALVILRQKCDKAKQERDDSETDESLPASPIYDRYQSGEGYHVVPPPYTGTFMLPKPNLVFHDAPNVHETIHTAFNVTLSPTKHNKDLSHTHIPSAPIIEDWVSDSEEDSEAELPQNSPSFVQPNEQVKTPRPSVKSVETSIPAANHKTAIPKPTTRGNSKNRKACFVLLTKSTLVPLTASRPVTTVVPQTHVTRPRQAKSIVTNPLSPPRRTINRRPSPPASTFPPKVTVTKAPKVNAVKGNMSYLSDFEEINSGYVAFGGNPKGGTECIVLSPEFKLPDENQVLLRVPRENNMYNVDLKNIVPFRDLTCLFAKATLDDTNDDATFKDKEPEFEGRKPESEVHVSPSSRYRNLSAEFEDFSYNSINEDNAAGTSVPTVGETSTNSTNTFSAAGPSNTAVTLEDITYSDDDDEDVGAEADFTNLETTITFSHIPTTKVHKDHPVTQIISDLSSATKTRSMTRVVKDQGFEDPDYSDKVYKVVKALYGLYQALRAWYKNLANYLLENGFQRGKIDQTLFIKRQKSDILLVQIYVDDIIFGSTNKDLCKVFEKLMKDKFQMSSMGELTFFLGLQVKQKLDGIFISQDKYVAEILRKFGLTDKKSASTPIDTEKPLLKDPNGEDVDVHTYKLMIGSLMYLTSSRPDIMKKVIITEATVRETLRLHDAESIDCLANEEIFTELSRMSLVRNVDSSSNFYMYPRFLQLMIRTQVGDLSSHTTKYSSPALTQKVFANMRRVGKGFSGIETPLFEGIVVAQQANDVADEGAAGIDVDVVPAVAAEPSIPSPTPTTQPPPPSQELPSTSQVIPTPPPSPLAQPSSPPQQPQPSQPTHDAENSMDFLHTLLETCTTLTRKVEALEQDKVAQALEIIKLKQRVKKLEKKHTLKVFGLRRLKKDDELEPAELKEVVEVVTTAKLMTEVVTTVAATITAATTPITAATIVAAPSAARKRKGVVIKDPKETDEAYARELEAEFNKNINKDDVIEQVQKKEKEDNFMLRNMAGFKMNYFKGMSYDDIRPIFDKYFNSNVAFLVKTKEQMEEEDNRALKRKTESSKEKAAKKQKLDEEVEKLKKHLQIVPNDDDDVYTEATPLALKVPVVDYAIYTENNKPYYKIIRADGSHQLFLSFLSLLRNFEREDLEMLWQLVKERFESSKPKNFSDDFLLW
nr:uncharacterized mitochondrial protein AtMg00810-like [Tanacetum cinerariifolium]